MNDLDSIHFEINRIYEQWDEREITYENAMQKAKDVCNKFIDNDALSNGDFAQLEELKEHVEEI